MIGPFNCSSLFIGLSKRLIHCLCSWLFNTENSSYRTCGQQHANASHLQVYRLMAIINFCIMFM